MMNDDHNKFSSVPASACCFADGAIEVGSNGDDAKSASIRLMARSPKPIEHWFWGKVVHDMAGMHLHKSRIALDYCHDSGDIIGYANRITADDNGLVLEGALTPWKDNDRASEIIAKGRAGVPYEASINFGGDGIKVEEVADGDEVTVNGFQFAGPGVVIREWPLRGTAVCPYGADMSTRAEFSDQAETYRVTTFKSAVAPEVTTADAPQEVAMEGTANEQAAELVASATETPVEAVTVEDVESVEAVELAVEETPVVDHRAEFKALVAEFGAEIAATVFADGGGRAEALELKIERLEEIAAEKELAASGGKITQAGGNPSAAKPKFEDMFKSKKSKS